MIIYVNIPSYSSSLTRMSHQHHISSSTSLRSRNYHHCTLLNFCPREKTTKAAAQEVGEQLWSAAAKRVLEANKATLADVKTGVKSSRPPDRWSIHTKAEGRWPLAPDPSSGRSRGSFVKLASVIQLCYNLEPAMSPLSPTEPLISITRLNTTFITQI